MAAEWYFQVNGEAIGPIPASELKRRADEGHISESTLVRSGTGGTWVEARQVKGLFPEVAKPPGQANDLENIALDAVATVANPPGSTAPPPLQSVRSPEQPFQEQSPWSATSPSVKHEDYGMIRFYGRQMCMIGLFVIALGVLALIAMVVSLVVDLANVPFAVAFFVAGLVLFSFGVYSMVIGQLLGLVVDVARDIRMMRTVQEQRQQ